MVITNNLDGTGVEQCLPKKGIAWGAIFGGVIVALITASLLNLLGISMGFAVFTINSSAYNFSIGALIWMLINIIISMGVGGWCATRLITFFQLTREQSILHGIIVWGVAALLMLNFMLTVSGIIVSGTLGTLVKGLASGAVATLQIAGENIAPEVTEMAKKSFPDLQSIVDKSSSNMLEGIKSSLNNSDSEIKKNLSPEMLNKIHQSVKTYLIALNEEKDSSVERNYLAKTLVEVTGLPQKEIDSKINNLQQAYGETRRQVVQVTEQAKQKVGIVAEKASNILAGLSFTIFLALLLGGIAAAVGAILGSQNISSYSSRTDERIR